VDFRKIKLAEINFFQKFYSENDIEALFSKLKAAKKD